MYRRYLIFFLVLIIAACTGQAEPESEVPTPTSETASEVEATPVSEPAEEPTEEPTEEPAMDDRPMLSIRLRDQDMQQLDPAYMSRSGDAWIAFNIYSRLVRWGIGTPDIEGDLAESWEFSEDGTEVTFHLREGVMWHKGYGEVTAEDIKFSYDRILDPNGGSPFNEAFSVVDHIEVLDKYTVRIFFHEQTATFLTSVIPWYGGFIVPKKAVEELGPEEFALNPIGSGPFIFDHWTPGTEVVLLANDDYYEGPPRVAGLRMLPIIDENAAVIALQSGDIKLAWLSLSESYEVLQQDPNIELTLDRSNAGRYLWLNTRQEPTDNVLVRRALMHAIDRQAISEFGFGGLHPALMTILPPNMMCHTDDVPIYDFDPDQARELLAEAGYPDGFSLTLLYSQRQVSQTIAELVQEMWSDIGVDLEITGLEHGTYTSIRRSPEEREDYDIIQTHFGRTSDPDSFLIETLHSGAFPPGSNASYYDQIDDLIDAGRTELDPDKRCEIYTEIQEKLQEDMPVLPIVNTTFLYAVSSDLKGLVPGSNNEFWAYPLYIEE